MTFPGVCLLLLAFLLVNPTLTLSASALGEETPDDNTNYDGQISAQADSGVTIAFTPASGSASLTPTSSAGASAKIDVSANVKIASTGGYTIYLSGQNAALTGNKTSQTIPATSSAKTFANLDTNTWGYAAVEGANVPDAATYSALPQGQGVKLAEGNGNATDIDRTFALSFATKIGNDKPADTYSNQVTLSVTSSPLQVSDLASITNMQEMTSEICASSVEGATKQLRDTRDGKYYWVTKLKDGRCWMTQNLALDLATNPNASGGTPKKFTDADTDLNSKTSWEPTSGTYTTVTDATILKDTTGQRSWNLGSYYIKTPNGTTSCGRQKHSLADCPTYFIALDTPTSANGNTDAHYLTSHYYQWCAATAGCSNGSQSGTSLTSGEASDSICPKGWKLPTGGTNSEFQTLMNKHNVFGIVESLVTSPLYFVKGGLTSQYTSDLFLNASYGGLYWSSTPRSTGVDAYRLQFSIYYDNGPTRSGWTDSIDTSSGARDYGFSVRCLAR